MFVRGQRPCSECHLWLCKCPDPPCETDEPTVQRGDDFVAKTHAELARIVGECRNERRFIAHPACSDMAPCVHCGTIRAKHKLLNDHLDQLELAALEDSYSEPA